MERPDIWLVFPPQWLPFAPPLSLAMLAAYLRSRGRSVVVDDVNRQAYLDLLEPSAVATTVEQARSALGEAERTADHAPPGYAEWVVADLFGEHVLAELPAALDRIANRRFGDLEMLRRSYSTVEAALSIQNARTPGYDFGLTHFRSPIDTSDSVALRGLGRRSSELPFHATLVRCARRIADARPRVLGISVICDTQLLAAIALANLVRELNADIHITVGGSAITYIAPKLAAGVDPSGGVLDSCVIQEGEAALARLLDALDTGDDLARIPNLWRYDSGLGRFCAPDCPDQFVAVNELPLPDYSGLEPGAYLAPVPSVCFLAFAKGCYWGKCTFCFEHIWHSERFKPRDAARIVDEMRELQRRWGVGHFDTVDLAIAPKFLARLGQEVAGQRLAVTWSALSKVEQAPDAAAFVEARRGGCVLLLVGVESTNDRVLALMKKGASRDATLRYLRLISAADIWVHSYIIVGFPSETVDDANETYQDIVALASEGAMHSVGAGGFTLLLETPIHANPDQFGIEISRDARPASLDFEVPYAGNALSPEGVRAIVDRYAESFDLPFNPAVIGCLLAERRPADLRDQLMSRELDESVGDPGKQHVRRYRWNFARPGDQAPLVVVGDPNRAVWRALKATSPLH